MYNIRIKQLPKNGDQRNYSLVDRNDLYIKVNPINQDSNVKNTISAVPREEANIEAEGGETVIGDINNDGFLEHSKIVGKRHSKGGVPLNVAPGSFIFSDTKKLKIKDPEVLSIFGITKFDKGGVTPAKIAQKYPMNNYMNILKDDTTDPVSKRTASQMLKNNLEKLGMLALVQESMKGFPDGVPAIAQSVMAGLQGQGEGMPEETMEGREAAGEEGQMRYGGMAMYQKAGTVKQKPKPKAKPAAPAPGTFYINGKPNRIVKTYEGFFDVDNDSDGDDANDMWVQFEKPIQVVDEDGNPDTMTEMTLSDWKKLTAKKSLKMGLTDNLIQPNNYTDINNLTLWNQDRSIFDIGRGVKYNTINYSPTLPTATATPAVKPQMKPGYTFTQGNKKYKVVAPDVYTPYGSVGDNREAVSVEQIDDPDQNISSFFDTKFGKKLIPIDEYNKMVGIAPTVVPEAAAGTTQADAETAGAKDWADTAEEEVVEEDTLTTKVVVKEDNSKPAAKTVVTPNTKVTQQPAKRVSGKMQVFPEFIVPSGKYKGQKAFAVQRGDTIRISYPDGTHEAFVGGKPLPGYKHGGDLPKHQGLDGSSTVGGGSGSMMDDGSSNGFFGGIGDFFSDLFSGEDKSKSDSATSTSATPSLDQQAMDAVANPAATSAATTVNIPPVATNTTVANPELPAELAGLFPADATPTAASQPFMATTQQGIQNGSVEVVPTGDPNKQVIANNNPKYTIEPSSVNKLPFTPQDDNTYAPFKKENYAKQWIPMANQAMSTPEGRQAIDDYLTNVASKGKYGPNILAALQGLTGQARYDKILELATDGDPGEFHNAFREAMTAKKPEDKPEPTPEKKRAWSCRQDPVTGVKEIYQFEYEGEMPAGSYNTREEAEAGCNKKPDDIPEKEKPKQRRPWWIQDAVNFAGTLTDNVGYYPPALTQVDLETPRYALLDPDRRIAAMQEQAAAEREAAYNTTAGNVAGASQVAPSNQRLGQSANIIGGVENENSNIFNRFSGNIAGINNQEKILNANSLQNYIGQSATARQQYDNARRALKWRQLDAWNNGTTNWQRTNQLSDMFNYDVDRNTGDVTFKDGRQMFDAQGRPVYDTYINPADPTGKNSKSGYTFEDRVIFWKGKGFSASEAIDAANAEVNGKAAVADTKTAGRNAILSGQALPAPRQSKYGGKVKKQYGGVVFDFGALPLYFFED
jgi:hypothetical protein